MNISGLSYYATGSCATLVLAACAGWQPPSGGPTMASSGGGTSVGAHSGPNRSAPGSDIIYLSRFDYTDLYSFPYGQYIASMPYSGSGLCSDQNGDVFLTSGNFIYEFAHGGTSPINTLSSASGYAANGGCSVDPTTGNLAAVVVSETCMPCVWGVEIYQHAQGAPTTYTDQTFVNSLRPSCGYDNAGNLFVDGLRAALHHHVVFKLDELPSHGTSLDNITFSQKIYKLGEVQWDGSYVTIEDRLGPIVYRVQVSGSTAKVVGKTLFSGATGDEVEDSWIQGSTIAIPFRVKRVQSNWLGLWNYPAGGYPSKTFQLKNGEFYWTSTVSIAAHGSRVRGSK